VFLTGSRRAGRWQKYGTQISQVYPDDEVDR
jgi:hypothetical protein